ncbi:MAG TPA: biotin/lipoyl-containing protein [Planctomycetaceae bacterium]|nr:biotin/lipoyl-containing protein [Planctomycetaceae bacterium]
MTAIAIRLPELGTAGEPVRVSCWLVDLGDDVDVGERIVEVLVRGITFDVTAPASGRVARIEKWLNATVATGDVLGWIKPGDADASE